MSTVLAPVTSLAVSAPPRVDLLPPEIAEERRFAVVRLGLAGVLVLAVGAVGALHTLEARHVTQARAELATAQARSAALTRTVESHAEVPVVFAEVDANRARLAAALGQEVRWSYQMNDISLHLPRTVWVQSLTVAPATQGAAATPAAPAAAGPAYTVTVSGKAAKVTDVADWLEVLAARTGWSDPAFTTAQVQVEGGRKVVTFESTAQVGAAALSRRYEIPGTTSATPTSGQ